MAAVSRCISAICVASILLRPVQLALAVVVPSKCPVLPWGSFPAAAELEAMSCIDPSVITGPINRIGKVVLSDLASISSLGSTCQQPGGELKALIPTGSGSLTAGPSTCDLVAVGFSKSDSSKDATVKLRMDFDKCNNDAPGTAVVMLNVVKQAGDFMGPSTIFPFIQEVCSVKTTTPAQSVAKTKLGFIETMVGNNTCSGSILRSYANVDKRGCKMLCVADVTRFSNDVAGLVGNTEVCRGFSFDTDTGGVFGNGGKKVCNLYKGKSVTEVSDPKGKAGLYCWNLTATISEYYESTPAPPTAAEISKADAGLPKLSVNVQLQAKSASISTYVSPNNTCFAPFSVVTLQDFQYQTISIQVKESEWPELLDMIPAPARRLEAASAGVAVAQVYVDRAVYGGAGVAPLVAADAAPVAPAVVTVTKKPACHPVPAPTSNGVGVFLINFLLVVGCALTVLIGSSGCMNSGPKIKGYIAQAQAAASKKAPAPAE